MNRASSNTKPIFEFVPHRLAEHDERIRKNIEANRKKKKNRKNYSELLNGDPPPSLVFHYMKAAKDPEADFFRGEWAKSQIPFKELTISHDSIPDCSPQLAFLSVGSFSIKFRFKLVKPYISRGDQPLYIIDNAVVRDKLLHLPMVRPTGWKGSLRYALWQLRSNKDDVQTDRLFGAASDDPLKSSKQGRLYFYPSFFTRHNLEVINPHDRETGVGSQPIFFETVPNGTQAGFTLLYAPIDRAGRDFEETKKQVCGDLRLIALALFKMFTVFGFGAKSSSGFGLADDKVENGSLKAKLGHPSARTETTQVQVPNNKEWHEYLDEFGEVLSAFKGSGEGGLMSNREYNLAREQLDGGSLSKFKKFRQWYNGPDRVGRDSRAESGDVFEVSFDSLSQLVNRIGEKWK